MTNKMKNNGYFWVVLLMLLSFDTHAIKPELKVVENFQQSISIQYKNGKLFQPRLYMLKNWTWFFMYNQGQAYAVNVEKSNQRFIN